MVCPRLPRLQALGVLGTRCRWSLWFPRGALTPQGLLPLGILEGYGGDLRPSASEGPGRRRAARGRACIYDRERGGLAGRGPVEAPSRGGKRVARRGKWPGWEEDPPPDRSELRDGLA